MLLKVSSKLAGISRPTSQNFTTIFLLTLRIASSLTGRSSGSSEFNSLIFCFAAVMIFARAKNKKKTTGARRRPILKMLAEVYPLRKTYKALPRVFFKIFASGVRLARTLL